MLVELLLARCPEVKLIQKMAGEMGIEKFRFPLENKDCILCGLCIRICEEKMGVSAITFVSRGLGEDVSTPFHISSETCIGCGACARLCPTGAIKIEAIEDMLRIRRFHNSKVMYACPS
jgi:ferredoxin